MRPDAEGFRACKPCAPATRDPTTSRATAVVDGAWRGDGDLRRQLGRCLGGMSYFSGEWRR